MCSDPHLTWDNGAQHPEGWVASAWFQERQDTDTVRTLDPVLKPEIQLCAVGQSSQFYGSKDRKMNST